MINIITLLFFNKLMVHSTDDIPIAMCATAQNASGFMPILIRSEVSVEN
jgi:hypothetical protein